MVVTVEEIEKQRTLAKLKNETLVGVFDRRSIVIFDQDWDNVHGHIIFEYRRKGPHDSDYAAEVAWRKRYEDINMCRFIPSEDNVDIIKGFFTVLPDENGYAQGMITDRVNSFIEENNIDD